MRIKYLAFALIFLTFCLLLLGGVVHNTESSLACPDWPLCYGQVFPKMEGGVLIEHSHRLLASLVGFLTIILVFFTYRQKKRDPVYAPVFELSVWALIMVITQGLLGGITVIYKLPTIVSTTHLGLSMIFFATLILIHHRLGLIETPPTYRKEALETFKPAWKPIWRHSVLSLGILLYLQILLGAFLRHSGSGAACGFGFSNSLLCFDSSSWSLSFWPELLTSQVHMIHRVFAAIITLLAFLFLGKVAVFFYRFRPRAGFFSPLFFASASLGLIILQVFLGIAVVSSSLHNIPTTAHLGVGALCLIFLWKLNLVLKHAEEQVFTSSTHSLLSDIVDLTKPKLSALVMVTFFVGMMLAPGDKHFFKLLLAFVLVSLVVFGAGALNCFIERDIDSKMIRTKNRSLPSGRLNPLVALIFGGICIFSATVLLGLFVNGVTALLGLLAAALYLLLYTPLKQKSELAVYIGAIPGAIPPIMGWTAVTGNLGPQAWALFSILFVWQLPHFMAISIYNARDYELADIKVYPNLKGVQLTKILIVFFTVCLGLTALLPALLGASSAYQKTALGLSLALTLISLLGFRTGIQGEKLHAWAKNYFWGTILYLPLLLGAMLFLRS